MSLTPREMEVLGYLRQGESAPRIAARLGISRHTVKEHLQNIFDKLPGQYKGVGPQRAILWWAYDTQSPR